MLTSLLSADAADALPPPTRWHRKARFAPPAGPAWRAAGPGHRSRHPQPQAFDTAPATVVERHAPSARGVEGMQPATLGGAEQQRRPTHQALAPPSAQPHSPSTRRGGAETRPGWCAQAPRTPARRSAQSAAGKYRCITWRRTAFQGGGAPPATMCVPSTVPSPCPTGPHGRRLGRDPGGRVALWLAQPATGTGRVAPRHTRPQTSHRGCTVAKGTPWCTAATVPS